MFVSIRNLYSWLKTTLFSTATEPDSESITCGETAETRLFILSVVFKTSTIASFFLLKNKIICR
jgi:hypothetical protein